MSQAPTHVFRTVRLGLVGGPVPRSTPRRPKNADVRSREHLTPSEVEALIATAKKRGRYCHRDATAILITYRHGLRVSELCSLTWDRVHFDTADLHVARKKKGKTGVHPLTGAEVR